MVNQNSKSPRFWTPKLMIDARHASCFIWYGGQVMKARMKKPLGSLQPRLTTRPSSFKTFTSLTQLSLDHYPLSECLIIYALKSLLKKKKKKRRTTFYLDLCPRHFLKLLSILCTLSTPLVVLINLSRFFLLAFSNCILTHFL